VNKRRSRTKVEQNCAWQLCNNVANTSLLQLCHSVVDRQQCDNCATVLQDCYKYFESVRVCAN
jgi:hypothetical protein